MIFQPLGLLALLAIPVIVGIHLFRRRYRPVVVTGLFLYGTAALAPTAGRQRERLRKQPSLLLEILAVLAATWFLCDPHWDQLDSGTHQVFLLDSRRSLQAEASDGLAVMTHARNAVRAQLANLRAQDRVTLIASGEPPRVLVGPASSVSSARQALDDWQCDHAWHELDAGVALAIALAAGGTTTVVSDRVPEGIPDEVAVIAVGEARPTAGLTAARWLRDSAGERLALQVLAQGADAERTVEVVADAQVIVRQVVTLRDRQAEVITVPVPADWSGETLTVRLLDSDPYPADDTLTLRRPAARTVAWQRVDLPAATATAVERALHAVEGARAHDTAAHLVIGTTVSPVAGQWSVTVHAGDAPAAMGPFLARRGDSVLADIDATGVLWSGGTRDLAALAGEALLLAGDAVLLSSRREGRDRHLQLWCDLERSTVTTHPAWPALWANIVAARAEALPGVSDPNQPCAVAIRLVLPPGHDAIVIQDPSGERSDLRADAEGVVIHPGLRQPGVHTVFLGTQDIPWLALHAHSLDARLADLMENQRHLRPAPVSGLAERERQRSPLAHLLPILLVAGCALGAWRAFAREQAPVESR